MKFAASLILLSLVALPLGAQSAPLAPQEPQQVFSLGGGIQGLGPFQTLGYYSYSTRVATGTYATAINEFARQKGGGVLTCARGGVSKALWSFGPFTIGVVGDAGACEGTLGSAGGAVSGRGFMLARFGKTHFNFIGTGETLNIAGSPRQTIISLGIGYAK